MARDGREISEFTGRRTREEKKDKNLRKGREETLLWVKTFKESILIV
jgi:hypothetical protein